MNAAMHAGCDQVALIMPNNPGLAPQCPFGATPAQISAADWQHTINLCQHKLVRNVEQAMKNQVIRAVHEQYFKGAMNLIMGAINRTLLDVPQYLYGRYGHTTADNLVKNQELCGSATTPMTPSRSFRRNWRKPRHGPWTEKIPSLSISSSLRQLPSS